VVECAIKSSSPTYDDDMTIPWNWNMTLVVIRSLAERDKLRIRGHRPKISQNVSMSVRGLHHIQLGGVS
jgi:hypothetical protein